MIFISHITSYTFVYTFNFIITQIYIDSIDMCFDVSYTIAFHGTI